MQGSGFRVQGSGFRVEGVECRIQGSGFRVQDSGFRDYALEERVEGGLVGVLEADELAVLLHRSRRGVQRGSGAQHLGSRGWASRCGLQDLQFEL